jgi:hypothetical protein
MAYKNNEKRKEAVKKWSEEQWEKVRKKDRERWCKRPNGQKEKRRLKQKEKYHKNKEVESLRGKSRYLKNKNTLLPILNERTKKRNKERRNILKNIKFFYGCCNPNCLWDGECDSSILQFHHIVPSLKTDDIARMVRAKKENLIDEINKCTVVCANCHCLIEHTDIDCSKFRYCKVDCDWVCI